MAIVGSILWLHNEVQDTLASLLSALGKQLADRTIVSVVSLRWIIDSIRFKNKFKIRVCFRAGVVSGKSVFSRSDVHSWHQNVMMTVKMLSLRLHNVTWLTNGPHYGGYVHLLYTFCGLNWQSLQLHEDETTLSYLNWACTVYLNQNSILSEQYCYTKRVPIQTERSYFGERK